MTNKYSKAITLSRVQNYWYRQGVIKYFFVLFLLGFGFRIVTINQLNAGPISLQEKASLQASGHFENKARRGDILDRNGNILASSRILKRVNLDPTQVQTAFIPKLAEALIMPEQELRDAIDKKLSKQAGRKNLVIKKNLPLTDPILENIANLKKIKLKICADKQIENKVSLLDKALISAQLKESKITYKTIKVCKNRRISGVRLQADTQRYYPKS
ncbi:MAG: penicillin-binding protein 2, partial [Candidatus Ruthia sp.]|nr:penicillin-binding protein 2 [Candidatus Ruthturnera sp.]